MSNEQQFVRRQIRVTLSTGGPGGKQTAYGTFQDYRTRCEIISVAGNAKGQAQVEIYGLKLSDINKFTSIGFVNNSVRFNNQIKIEAGNEGENLSLIYEGTIASAVGEFRDPPNVGLIVHGITGQYQSLKTAKTTSYNGSTDVAQAMSDLAQRAGYGLKNEGVQVKLPSPYLTGSLIKQMHTLRKHAKINMTIDRNTVYIWPKGKSLNYPPVVVTPGTNLVGYPRFSSQSVDITTRFIPGMMVGDPVEIQNSSLPLANGPWHTAMITHRISSQDPNGPWFTDMKLQRDKAT